MGDEGISSQSDTAQHHGLAIGLIYTIISLLGILANVILAVVVLKSKQLKENASYWLLANITLCNAIHLLVYAFGAGISMFGLPFLDMFPICYFSLPLAMTAYLAGYINAAIYTIITVREARLEVADKTSNSCGRNVILAIIIAIWIACLLEVLVLGYGIDGILYDKVCLFMHSAGVNVFYNVLNVILPSVILFICGFILCSFSCKSSTVCGTSTPVMLMCILTPLIELPFIVTHLVSVFTHVPLFYTYMISQVAWMVFPLYFLLFGELRSDIKNLCCNLCKKSENEESSHLVMK